MRRCAAIIAGLSLLITLLHAVSAGAAQAPMPTFTYRPGGGQPPAPTQPPWYQTQERRPKEVKDKETETPLCSCENTDGLTGEKINVVYYSDSETGARTTVRKIQTPAQPRIGSPTPPKTVWEILIETPGQPKKKITYQLEPGNETRSEKTGKEKPATRKMTGDDMYTPPVKKSSIPVNFEAPVFARIAVRGREAAQPRRDTKLELAAVVPSPFPAASSTSGASGQPQGMSLSMKSVALGEPPQLFFAMSDFSPPMTADEYVLSQAFLTLRDESRDPEAAYYWDGVDNPGVFRPGDSFTTQDGEHIQIVGDWSLAAVPGGFVMSCGGFDMDDEDDYGWRYPYRVQYEAA